MVYTMIIPYDQAISCDLLTWFLKSSSFMTLKLVENSIYFQTSTTKWGPLDS